MVEKIATKYLIKTLGFGHIKKELNYYSIEIYNYDIKKIINALNLTNKN